MDDLIMWLRGVLDEDEREARGYLNGGSLEEREHSMPEWRLADIAAKRAILDELCGYDQVDVTLPGGPPETVRGRQSPIAGPLARLLASAYSTRPGYQADWAPNPPKGPDHG